MKSVFLILSLPFFLFACSPQQEQSQTDEKTEVQQYEEPSQTQDEITSTPVSSSPLEQSRGIPLGVGESLSVTKHLLINGRKMEVSDPNFAVGDMLFDVAVQQKAIIKGSFTVVMNDNQTLEKNVTDNYKVESIAHNTFRLVPYDLHEQEKTPLHVHFSNLKDSASFKQVELDLYYEGQGQKALM